MSTVHVEQIRQTLPRACHGGVSGCDHDDSPAFPKQILNISPPSQRCVAKKQPRGAFQEGFAC